MTLRVASWNLFHGRAQPPVHRDLFADVAAVLGGADWEVCALQELPPWWARPLAKSCGASLRVARTSFSRGALPLVQRKVSAGDPERFGARGAAVNALLVRPSAGRIADDGEATLRWLPQRRSVHAVRLVGGSARSAAAGADAGGLWVANVHTHNRPSAAAADDLRAALDRLRTWSARTVPGDPQAAAAKPSPAVLLGDLNVPREAATRVATEAGFSWLAGHRVDHVLAVDGIAASGTLALAPRTLDGGAVLSDHRLLTVALGVSTSPAARSAR